MDAAIADEDFAGIGGETCSVFIIRTNQAADTIDLGLPQVELFAGGFKRCADIGIGPHGAQQRPEPCIFPVARLRDGREEGEVGFLILLHIQDRAIQRQRLKRCFPGKFGLQRQQVSHG